MLIIPNDGTKKSKLGFDKKEFVFAVAILSSLAASFIYDKWLTE
jgi:hypothetical protein